MGFKEHSKRALKAIRTGAHCKMCLIMQTRKKNQNEKGGEILWDIFKG